MRLVLDGLTAFEFWMCAISNNNRLYVKAPSPSLTLFEAKSGREISQIVERTGGKEGRIELLVREPEERRQTKILRCNYWGHRPIPPRSLCHIGDGLYVISPELCVVRLARLLPRLEFLRATTDLLGIYAYSFTDRQDLIGRKQILNLASLEAYLNDASGLPGTKLVRQALSWLPERSASPRETTMDLCLALPTRLGGQGLMPFEANFEVKPSDDAKMLTQKRRLSADVAWSRRDLFLEYNSNKHHDTEEQMEFDFEKITTFDKMGKRVIPISTRQFNDYEAFQAIADEARSVLGVRDRYADDVAEKRRRTHGELIRLEREQRERPPLAETARWRFLLPYLDLENPI